MPGFHHAAPRCAVGVVQASVRQAGHHTHFVADLKCKIPRTALRSDHKGEYTVFVIELSLGSETWTVMRRYSEFHALNAELQVGLRGGGDAVGAHCDARAVS